MKQLPSEEVWRVRLVGSRLPWNSRPDRPADVGDELCATMLTRKNMLEDANYQKIAPNQFVVEIGLENYGRNYQLLHEQILRQWNEKLLDCLLTANSRQGRQEFHLAGPIKIEIHPVADLGSDQARIYCRVQAGAEIKSNSGSPVALPACLEILPGGQRIALHAGIITMGRNKSCDIYLDDPEVQQKKLVSGKHAYLSCRPGSYHLFDGAPDGKPSLNGTFVNLRRLPPGGVELKNGDLILLATLDPHRPDPDTPGVASLRFYQDCQ